MSKWNYENIKKEVDKYIYRNDFRKGSSGAYQAALKLGILDEICSHMPRKTSTKWNSKNIAIESKKYGRKDHFHRNSSGAYYAAKRLGILDEVCSHMPLRRVWNIENVTAEAKKYNTSFSFYKGSGSAYNAAKRLGIMDEICSHMTTPSRTHLYFMKIHGEKNLWKVGITKNFKKRYAFLVWAMPFEKFSNKYVIETNKCDIYKKEILSMGNGMIFGENFQYSSEFKLYDGDVVDDILENYFGVG